MNLTKIAHGTSRPFACTRSAYARDLPGSPRHRRHPPTNVRPEKCAPMDSTRTTTRDIRRQNRSILLSKLFFDGPLSRLELSQLTGLSSATVSTVTAELIDDRLIVEAGQVESGGGRPRVLLRVDPTFGYVVGVDVGETGVTVELFDIALAAAGQRGASGRVAPTRSEDRSGRDRRRYGGRPREARGGRRRKR